MNTFQKFNDLKADIKKGLSAFYEQIVTSFVETSKKCRNLKKTNLELAKFHLEHAHFTDAIFRYWIIINIFKIRDAAVYYNLGLAHLLSNSRNKAILYFRETLLLDPQNTKCQFRIASIETPSEIAVIPSEIIEEDYNIWAKIYSKLVLETKYIGPDILIQAYQEFIQEHSKEEREIKTVFDLGCGYGIAGYLAKRHFKIDHLYGVDISKQMLSKAKQLNAEEKVFAQFYHEDFLHFKDYPHKADLVIASYSLQFAQDLQPFFKTFKAMSNKVAHLLFSVPLSKSGSTVYNEHMMQFEYTVSDIEQWIKAQKFSKAHIVKKNISSNQEAIVAIITK
jgi:predicted TPR repeat methyltransferase